MAERTHAPVPPGWQDVWINPDRNAPLVATGYDDKGRKQYHYSHQWKAQAKDQKFGRVRQMLLEAEAVRAQIESDINDPRVVGVRREAALVAYLMLETGMRPGTNSDALADVAAYGAATLQLRHLKPGVRAVNLVFVGKKGVRQNVRVTNQYLVEELRRRKAATRQYTRRVFKVSGSTLNGYIAGLGDGHYTSKDFRTMKGCLMAHELLGQRKRLPKARAARKRLANAALDRIAKALGNTRAVAKVAYVDPVVLERYFT